jgi:glucuronokinase
VILDIEKVELGMSAGLQDRVIQVYGGLVHMDFSGQSVASPYTPLPVSLLPPLYLAYNTQHGGESGKVHSTVRDRWDRQDEELVSGMRQLGDLADQAVQSLQSNDIPRLAQLMEQNFALRRKLYGDAVVGIKNIAMVERAAEFGLAAKFTGSGGALVCCRRDGLGR